MWWKIALGIVAVWLLLRWARRPAAATAAAATPGPEYNVRDSELSWDLGESDYAAGSAIGGGGAGSLQAPEETQGTPSQSFVAPGERLMWPHKPAPLTPAGTGGTALRLLPTTLRQAVTARWRAYPSSPLHRWR